MGHHYVLTIRGTSHHVPNMFDMKTSNDTWLRHLFPRFLSKVPEKSFKVWEPNDWPIPWFCWPLAPLVWTFWIGKLSVLLGTIGDSLRNPKNIDSIARLNMDGSSAVVWSQGTIFWWVHITLVNPQIFGLLQCWPIGFLIACLRSKLKSQMIRK